MWIKKSYLEFGIHQNPFRFEYSSFKADIKHKTPSQLELTAEVKHSNNTYSFIPHKLYTFLQTH